MPTRRMIFRAVAEPVGGARIQPRIARRGIEDTQRLGRHRWVVKTTFAWLDQMRRLATRYERRTDIHYAFTLLGCSLICFKQLKSRF